MCFDKRNNAEYALKVIKKTDDPDMSQLIKNELSILKSINHPNIINYIHDIVTPTDVYLITDLVCGGDLFNIVHTLNIDLPECDIQLITRNLASALAYIHSMNIVHGDVKLENILVEHDESGRILYIKLADFGLSQIATEPLYTICGTPEYIAPEIISESGYGLKVDIWAAGVTLYILLCGFPPFIKMDSTIEQLFDAILSGEYDFPKLYWNKVSEDTKDLVRSMLQSNPSSRISANDVLNDPWCNNYDL